MIIHTYDMLIFEEFEIFSDSRKLSNVGHLVTVTHKVAKSKYFKNI